MNRSIIRFVGLLMSLGLLMSCANRQEIGVLLPNIVLIVADDLGYGDLSCYGNTSIYTPNLDLLASEGIRFMDFHSNGTVCSPTRAALMTGKYQQRTGVEGVITAKTHREVGMDLDEVTIAEELKMSGYQCAIFGKWHLGYAPDYNPIRQGFDEFVGFVSGNVDFHAHIDQQGYLDWWKGDKIENEKGYTTDLITDYGMKFIEKSNPAKTKKPFFLYLPHEAPHYPYQRRLDKAVREVGKAGSRRVDQDSIASIYKEMVEVMDEGIGKIIQTLKLTGQYENTMIVFLSDNGASHHGNNGVLRGHKGGPYEGGSRVPAIICFPKIIKRGQVNNQTVLTMSLLPTILDFIEKHPSGHRIDGISIKEHLIDQADLPARDVFFSFKNQSFIRSGHWKLIRTRNSDEDKFELYNLSIDLQESQDLAQDHSDLTADLSTRLEKWENEVRKGATLVAE